jgi:hypothetical protein
VKTSRSDLNFKRDRLKIQRLVLCEEHFAENEFSKPKSKGTGKKRKTLKKTAIPTLFTNLNAPKLTEERRHLNKTMNHGEIAFYSFLNCICLSLLIFIGNDTTGSRKKRKLSFSQELQVVVVDEPEEPPSSARKSPSKAELRRKMERYRKRCWRLQRDLERSQKELANNKKRSDLEIAREVLKEKLTPDAYNVVVAQLCRSQRSLRKRWPREVKLYCLALSYTSPAAYRFLRKAFKIPENTTANVPKFES